MPGGRAHKKRDPGLDSQLGTVLQRTSALQRLDFTLAQKQVSYVTRGSGMPVQTCTTRHTHLGKATVPARAWIE